MVKPSFQVFSLSSKATNKVPSVVRSCTLRVAGVVMGFLLHSYRLRVMEKKLTNSGPLMEPADKHSIYAITGGRRCGKTSLLLQIAKDLEAQTGGTLQFLPRFLDLQGEIPHSNAEFFM